MVDGLLYICTPDDIIHALDPETGKARWIFNANNSSHRMSICRGVSYYKVPGASGKCASRIFHGTGDARLWALDAKTGEPCPGFGDEGVVDLKENMGRIIKSFYHITSAPTVVEGNVIVGGWISDNQMVGSPPGVIRAFDAETGEFSWAFDMDKPGRRGEPENNQTYSLGSANSWAPMSGDEELGLVYVPTGNSTPDYWGAHRSSASEKYGSSVLALDAKTGEMRWSFQTTHHDLWDYDVASQPTLVDLPVRGEIVPALIIPTKRGEIFLLDRRNGKALSEVTELPVPQGAASGDWVAETQPFSTGMPSFGDTELSEESMWGMTPLDQLWCRIKFKEARYEGTMTPPGVEPSIGFPGYLGGINWGSVAVDPEKKKMVVNWSIIANYTRLVPREEAGKIPVSDTGHVRVGDPVPMKGTPFALLNGPFLSPLGMPCNQPPFGKIAVVDLEKRKLIWERPLGTSRDLGPLGIPSMLPFRMGIPNMGGSITTRSGLIFIGAAMENTFRAFDLNTGKILWSTRVPAAIQATPMTYIGPKSGRQFVVVTAGGSDAMGTPRSDSIIAYSLPSSR